MRGVFQSNRTHRHANNPMIGITCEQVIRKANYKELPFGHELNTAYRELANAMNCAAAYEGQFNSWSRRAPTRNHDAKASIHAIEDCKSLKNKIGHIILEKIQSDVSFCYLFFIVPSVH